MYNNNTCGNYNFPSQNAIERGQGVNGIGNQNGVLGNVDPAAKNEFDRMMDAPNAAQNAGQSDGTSNGGDTLQQFMEQIMPLLMQLISSIGQPNQGQNQGGDYSNNAYGSKSCG